MSRCRLCHCSTGLREAPVVPSSPGFRRTFIDEPRLVAAPGVLGPGRVTPSRNSGVPSVDELTVALWGLPMSDDASVMADRLHRALLRAAA